MIMARVKGIETCGKKGDLIFSKGISTNISELSVFDFFFSFSSFLVQLFFDLIFRFHFYSILELRNVGFVQILYKNIVHVIFQIQIFTRSGELRIPISLQIHIFWRRHSSLLPSSLSVAVNSERDNLGDEHLGGLLDRIINHISSIPNLQP